MIKITRSLTVLLLCFCSSTYAEIWDSKFTEVITVTGGIAITNPGNTQTKKFSQNTIINVAESEGEESNRTYFYPLTLANTYHAHEQEQASATGELFLGLQWVINQYFTNQLGFAFGGAGGVDLQGTIDIDEVPQGSRYIYHINHAKAVVRDKLLFSTCYSFQPFITGSFGASFNRAYGFLIKPPLDLNRSIHSYRNNTHSFGVTYSLGFGVQKNFSGNWNASIGYEFADWGRSSLGRGTFERQQLTVMEDVDGRPFILVEPKTYGGLDTRHIYANNLLFSLSYLF